MMAREMMGEVRHLHAVPQHAPEGEPEPEPQAVAAEELHEETSEPAAGTRLYRYEVRVRTIVSQALVASMPVRTACFPVGRHAVRSLRVRGDRDIVDVMERLSRAGVQVLEIAVRRPLP
jgi:hypothetical protein